VIFREGDMVKLKGMGDALWCIEKLGEQTYYASGDPLSEEPTLVSLYTPEPQLPRIAYPKTTWTHREFMVEVPAMLVLALEASRPERSRAAELLLEQKYRRRVAKKTKLEALATYESGRMALLMFKAENPDLFYEQETFKAEWSTAPITNFPEGRSR
jgi:hypothetical protein